ncbi:MAG: hypothetical protein AAF716_03380 [Cyanobacteria bacterium P01_D01_bin.1]
MNEAGFDASRWDHWLLLFGAVVGLGYALWLSWQWNWEGRQKRRRDRTSRRIRAELYGPELSKASRQDLRRLSSSDQTFSNQISLSQISSSQTALSQTASDQTEEQLKIAMRSRNRFLN